MFSSRIPKEKDEDGDDVEMATHSHEKTDFNLESILLKSDNVESSTIAAFRSGPSSLYKGSHRRRRTAPPLSSGESENYRNLQHRHDDRCDDDDDERAFLHHSHKTPHDSRFTELLARNFKVPFILLLVLVFWGPMLMQMGGAAAIRRPRTLSGSFTPFERDDPEYARLIEESGHGRGHSTEKKVVDEDEETGNDNKDAVHDNSQETKLSNPVLNALRAVQNTDFKLPARKIEGDEDDKFRPENLSEDEQEELKIQVQRVQPKKHQSLERQETFGAKEDAAKLSPLEQYQLRTQQEEQLQLKHYQEQKLQQRQQLPPHLQAQIEPPRIPQQQLQPPWVQQQQQWAQQWQPPVNQQQVQRKWQPPVPPEIRQPPPLDPPLVFKYVHAGRPDMIPEHFQSSFSNVWDPPSEKDTALFWHIPKNGGTTVADILTHCVDLVSASSIGASEGHGTEHQLQVRTYHDKGRYVNVNTASIPGIKHAKELGLAASGLADVVVLHRLHEGSELFDPFHKARVFCMFRNPVHRAVSMFYYLQKAKWEPTYDPTLSQMTLEQYANSNKVEENWVTRFLVHRYTGPLGPQDLEEAKQVMRDKIIVGLLDDFQASLKRFELYFDWWGINKQKGTAARMVQCQQNHERNVQNKISHPIPNENDPGYRRLLQLNWADMQLYEYAKQLFVEQGEFVQHKDASLL